MEKRPSTAPEGIGLTEDDQKRMRALYHGRLHEHGLSPTTVGWRSKDDQFLRFAVLCRDLDLRGKRILDVGCGLGDFVEFADERFGSDYDYLGIDISGELVDAARQARGNERRRFEEGTLGKDMSPGACDICIMSGALSFKTTDNVDTMKKILSYAYDITTEAVCCNFLSSYVDFQLEKNFHYRPEDVFTYAKSLTRWVTLHHDYPLYEFTIQLLHKPR